MLVKKLLKLFVKLTITERSRQLCETDITNKYNKEKYSIRICCGDIYS